MRFTNTYISVFFGLLSYSIGYSQGTIQSIVPAEGMQGQSLQIVIKGAGTTWSMGGVTVDLGNDIQILDVDVRNSVTLYVSAEVLNTAFPEPRDLHVTSNGETLELLGAFTVIDKNANEVFAILEINPVQVLYASDFDPDNLGSEPIVFQVTVLNDQQTRTLKTFFYLILEGEGLILTAIKEHGEVMPSATTTFDNREFDEFELNEENAGIASQIIATGMLPPGQYTYKIEVRQGNEVLVTTEGQNTLLNQAGDLIMISPGSPIDQGDPKSQMAAQPLFQWISSANQFDLFLYEVPEGQSNTQEIVQQLPVFREMNILGNSFLYPLSAEPLEEGKTYAWQLRAYFNNPTGNTFFDGPLHWFTYDTRMATDLVVGSIEIIPDYLEIKTRESFQFDVIARNREGEIIDVKPNWLVYPDNQFGTIDSSGLFVAGDKMSFGAVEVHFGQQSTYCIIKLLYSGKEFNVFDMLFQNPNYKVIQSNR